MKRVKNRALESAIVDQKIALLLLADGEECSEIVGGFAGTMQLVMGACQLDGVKGPDVNKLKLALNTAVELLLSNRYETRANGQLIEGLDLAGKLAYRVKPASIDTSWKEILK